MLVSDCDIIRARKQRRMHYCLQNNPVLSDLICQKLLGKHRMGIPRPYDSITITIMKNIAIKPKTK